MTRPTESGNLFGAAILAVALFALAPVSPCFAQTTVNDWDWAATYVELRNTPEADLMARTGDIDNLGFGWPAGFDPFSGNSTPVHSFPWTVQVADPAGTDRIMVVSSYDGSPPAGQDGYTATTGRPDNLPQSITLTYSLDGLTIVRAQMQLFVDDFQASLWHGSYQVHLDGVRAGFMETTINALLQTGPIGKLITVEVPAAFFPLLADGAVAVLFDDPITGAGDGFAVDFVKLLVNPIEAQQQGTVTGRVVDDATGAPLPDATVLANSVPGTVTDTDGRYTLEGVTAGLATVRASASGYGSVTKVMDVIADQTVTLDFRLRTPAPEVIAHAPEDEATGVSVDAAITVQFNQPMSTATLGASSFTVSSPFSTVQGTYVATADALTFTPGAPLQPGTTYQATVSTAARNEAGIALTNDFSWTFTTTHLDGQVSVILSPVADAGVYEYSFRNWDNGNLGHYATMRTGWNSTGGELRAYVRFDLAGLPPAQQATLHLYYTVNAGAEVSPIGFHAVTGTWLEGTGTYISGVDLPSAAAGELSWHQQPSFDPTYAVQATPPVDVGSGAWLEVDITPLMLAWQLGAENHGVAIMEISPGTNADYIFSTREAIDVTLRPKLVVVSASGTSIEARSDLPGTEKLKPVFPNPFRARATITFTLGHPEHARLAVFDLLGREVEVLADGVYSAGEHRAVFEALDRPGGIYFYRLQVGGRAETRPMLLLR